MTSWRSSTETGPAKPQAHGLLSVGFFVARAWVRIPILTRNRQDWNPNPTIERARRDQSQLAPPSAPLVPRPRYWLPGRAPGAHAAGKLARLPPVGARGLASQTK